MLCTSVSYAQSQQPLPVFPSSENPGNVPGGPVTTPLSYGGAFYVACWAEVPSRNTAYFSATFAAPAVNAVRKQFRSFVTTQYGPVSRVQCAGKFSQTVVNEDVEKWKDSARTAKNAIVDIFGSTRDEVGAPQPRSPQAASYQHAPWSSAGPRGIAAVPCNTCSGTAANQSSFQR
jgi:hypothetical protein